MLSFFLTLLAGLVTPVQAATVTPSPSPTPIVTGTATSAPSLNDIQKLREAVQQKVKEKLKEITSATAVNSKRAYVGTITALDPTQITVTFRNQTKKLDISDDTVYIDAKRNKAKYDSLKVGQDILAMGYVSESGSLTTKRIVISDLKAVEVKTQITIGQIVDLSKSSPIMVLVPSNNKDRQYQIKLDTKTEITDNSGNKLAQKNLNTGDKIIAVINPDPKVANNFTATKIISLTPAAQKTSPSPTPSIGKTPRQ